jgi:hypothetical protein
MSDSTIMTLMGSIIILLSGFITWFWIFMYGRLKANHSDLETRYDDAVTNGAYWHRRYREINEDVEDKEEQFLRQFETELRVGYIFSVPDTTTWKDQFRNTTQKIIDINFEKGTFRSVSTETGRGPDGFRAWTNKFVQIKDFTWVNNKGQLKHKFI